MRHIITPLLALAISSTALAHGNITQKDDDEKNDEKAGFVFTDIVIVPTTSVKDQNKSGTCWCFAGTSFYEDEILRKSGKELDLSEMFTVRQCFIEKADRFVRLYGQTNFGPGGSVMDVPHVWKNYGVIPEEVYSGIEYGEEKHIHGELDAILSAYLEAVVAKGNKRLSTSWRKGFEAILDAYLGAVPESFVVEGVTYTPKTYAEHLGIDTNDYIGITSFTHHPFYETFAVEVPDNWLWAQYYNLPMLEMKTVVDNAIQNGYPVVWAADVSEKGFKWKEGIAVMPQKKTGVDLEGTELSRWVHLSDADREKEAYNTDYPVEEIAVTQESRQEMFDRQETTDDHGMEIVGIATDQDGNRYYKVKNSWDTNQIYDGFFYVSEAYFLAKTMNIYVNKAALPNDIATKLKL